MGKRKVKKFSMKKWRKSHKKYLKWAEQHPILAWLSPRFYRLPDLPRDIKLSIVSFIQRGQRGWSNRDTWGLCDHLSEVIYKSIRHLKKNINGYPGNLTEGQWIDILNQIADTFETVNQITNGELYLITNKKKKEQWQKSLNEINKECGGYDRCMTTKEIIRYKYGWKLFEKYFMNLWD